MLFIQVAVKKMEGLSCGKEAVPVKLLDKSGDKIKKNGDPAVDPAHGMPSSYTCSAPRPSTHDLNIVCQSRCIPRWKPRPRRLPLSSDREATTGWAEPASRHRHSTRCKQS